MTIALLNGDVRTCLASVKDDSVQCVVTSPPYFGLRDYKLAPQVWRGERHCNLVEHCWDVPVPGSNRGGSGTPTDKNNRGENYGRDAERGRFCLQCGAWRGSLGLEPTPELYVEHLVTVFREVRRALRRDGCCFLNLGDSYAGSAQGWGHAEQVAGPKQASNRGSLNQPSTEAKIGFNRPPGYISSRQANGLKPKDLVGIPWMVAFALRFDGWWLRQKITWCKPNGMPESVKDRPTSSTEEIFLLSKSESYFYDDEAVRMPPAPSSVARWAQYLETQRGSDRAHAGEKTNGPMKAVGGPSRTDKQRGHGRRHQGFNERWDLMERNEQMAEGSNLRNWWIIPTESSDDAHFAKMPEALAAICVLAGSRVGDLVLDPFCGSGTVLAVAQRFGRKAIGIELNADYCKLAKKRLHEETLGLPL